jgi:hypothetical protein
MAVVQRYHVQSTPNGNGYTCWILDTNTSGRINELTTSTARYPRTVRALQEVADKMNKPEED